jgi:thiamine-phosphate pyrophosphorylase
VLCYVTDRRSLAGPAEATELLLEKIAQAANAGVDWIQLREKDLSGNQLAELAQGALQRATSSSAILINDRLDVALAGNAGGVHLGERSLPVKEAKKLVNERDAKGHFLVGASVHSLDAAVQAEADGADYVIFGPVYATPAKAEFGQPQGLVRLQALRERVKIPVLAIGGIALENARECFAAGASGIAAIRLFQDAADLRTLVSKLRGGI